MLGKNCHLTNLKNWSVDLALVILPDPVAGLAYCAVPSYAVPFRHFPAHIPSFSRRRQVWSLGIIN